MRTIVLGDVHGDWQVLNSIIYKYQPDLILQCGDFGYWPRFELNIMKRLKTRNTKIYFCEGNHDDLDSLHKLPHTEVYPNVFYQKRGSTLALPDGRNILFMGGAQSIDKDTRVLGKDWFEQEILTEAVLLNLPEINIDIVISHTCPKKFDINNFFSKNIICEDPSRLILDKVLDKYKPKEWFFGHWHKKMTGESQGCQWVALNDSNNRDGWWVWL